MKISTEVTQNFWQNFIKFLKKFYKAVVIFLKL